jgi:hypothetical protein
MALVPDQKFSTFQNGGNLAVGDTVVGLRGGINTRFLYTGELPPAYVVPIDQGGTGATTVTGARANLGLGTMAVQDANAVAITGGTAALASGQVLATPVNPDDLVNKDYVDSVATNVITWNAVAGTTQAVDLGNGYITNNAAQTTLTLPAAAPFGSVCAVQGQGAGGWIVQANGGQTIQGGSEVTTSGGSITSQSGKDNVFLLCVVMDSIWQVTSTYSQGLDYA